MRRLTSRKNRGPHPALAPDPELLNRITLMVASDDHLDFVSAAAGTTSLRARLCIDVDAALRLGPVHIGVRRSPLREPSAVAAFAKRAAARGFAVGGVMFYEAQVAGLPHSSPPIGWMKRASTRELATRRGAVVNAVQSEVGALEIVNSGGTGSLEVSSADPVVTEVTAGSGLYVPTLFDRYR